MLVLSRQRDESIVIGNNVVITVVDIRGDKVRLGIQARRTLPYIDRKSTTPFRNRILLLFPARVNSQRTAFVCLNIN